MTFAGAGVFTVPPAVARSSGIAVAPLWAGVLNAPRLLRRAFGTKTVLFR
jgi:hypothetical protein